jgi:hypothetical protein
MSAAERRCEPRFPLNAPVLVGSHGRSVAGRLVDASALGLLVELPEPPPFTDDRVGLRLSLAGGHFAELEADVVRRAVSAGGSTLLGLHLVGPVAGRALTRWIDLRRSRRYRRRIRPSRAKPRPPRPAAEARWELHALGTRLLELTLAEPDERASPAMVRWVARLAGELGQESPVPSRSNRLLLRDIADLHRTSEPCTTAPPRDRVDGAGPPRSLG